MAKTEPPPRIHPDIQDLAVPVADLQPFERNPRRGNVDLIAKSLEANGQYRPIVVNKGTHTGRTNEVLAGNHTYAAANRLDWDEIAATFVDVDTETAAKIVVMDNRASDLAKNDPDALGALLSDLSDLEGTGYTDTDLAKLLGADVADDDDEVFASRFEVVVECADEDAQQAMFDRLTGEGHTCRVLTL
jgi:ParB-like chromosome segregation protein Spo0J